MPERADASVVAMNMAAAGLANPPGRWRRYRVLRHLPATIKRRALREVWIDADPPRWAFPSWRPRWRPYDWAEDA